jgi:hypothetical protein
VASLPFFEESRNKAAVTTKPNPPKVPSWIWLAYISFILLFIVPFLTGIVRTLVSTGYPYTAAQVAESPAELAECRTRLKELTQAFETHLADLPSAARQGDELSAANFRADLVPWRGALDLLAARCHLSEPQESSKEHTALSTAYRGLTAIQARAEENLALAAQERTALMQLVKEKLAN